MAGTSNDVADVEIQSFVIFANSGLGTLDLTKTKSWTASIYQSIFTPCMVCDFTILDTNDQIGILKLSGGDIVNFNIKTPGGVVAYFQFVIDKIDAINMSGSQKGKTYIFKCVSREGLFAKHTIQKSYNGKLCSDIITDIHKNYLRSQKLLIVEPSKGPQQLVLGSGIEGSKENAWTAIYKVKNESISSLIDPSSNLSYSLYTFFESLQNGNQTFMFKTIESMFTQKSTKNFQQSDAINTSINNRKDNNILSYKLPRQASATEKISIGGPVARKTFNPSTLIFTNDILSTDTEIINTSENFNQYYNYKTPHYVLMPVDYYIPLTGNPESIAQKQARLASYLQNSIKIRVPGDIILTAGALINCFIPNKLAITGPRKADPFLSGDFVISRIHHRIGSFSESPRYTCIIEGLKGKYSG